MDAHVLAAAQPERQDLGGAPHQRLAVRLQHAQLRQHLRAQAACACAAGLGRALRDVLLPPAPARTRRRARAFSISGTVRVQ
jgi:hypothetical protein